MTKKYTKVQVALAFSWVFFTGMLAGGVAMLAASPTPEAGIVGFIFGLTGMACCQMLHDDLYL